MTARSTIFGEEGTEFLRRMADFGAGLRACFEGSGFACFTGLGPALPVLAAGKPGIAQQLYRGIFAFAGHTIDCQPAQVFSILPPSAAWADRLHGFAWLAHLEAPGLALYRNFARCLIQNWAGRRLRSSFEASCRRLISLSLHSGFLLKDSSPCFQAQFLALVSRETLRLAKLRPRTPAAQLRQSIAVLTAGLAFRGGGTLRNDALARTAALMTAFVLPDGGLADRSPKSLLDLLSDLVPLRAALEDQRIAIPRELNAAIERAIPMLRMLCHGDGGLAVFHGVEHTNPAGVRAIFERDGVLGRPHSHAVYSGYCRMNQGHSTVIVDCGPPSICDSGLAFEFSEGPQRIVGSCGVPANASPAWRAAAQSPAAHSTLQWEDKPAQNIQSILGRKMRRAKPAPIAELAISNHGTLFKAGNASPATGLGHLHVRELFLA
ncbi:MAG: heparinase II/III domain-containing protein, partial [Aestuariivirga sp.]